MRRKRAVAALVWGASLVSSALFAQTSAPIEVPPPASANDADELVGLWKAKHWFGPFARGALVITESGGTYTADMVGQRAPVRMEGKELVFDLANGQGTFRGKLESAGVILGHWFPPKNTTVFAGGTFASPVRLRRDATNRWSGEVVPYDDVFTLYLLVQERPDGSLSVLLRNPERDFGAWLGVERLVREGKIVKLLGKRRGQTEEQELATGSYDPDTDVITLSFPSRGGSYDFRRDDKSSDFYPRGRQPAPYVYREPPPRDDGWPTSSVEEVDIDRQAVERFIQVILDMPMDTIDAPQIHGLLLARHGKLVLEEYFHGEHRDKLHDTRSAAKSLTATIAGAAMESGASLSLSTPVYQTMIGDCSPADSDQWKCAMTLEHLLTMSSGYFCDDTDRDAPGNEETMLDQTEEPDYYRYTLQVPMASAPGEKAVYCSANPNLALGVVGRTAGESPMYLFDRLLGDPMKIHSYGWLLDPAGQPYGGGSVNFLPRDFMKLGQLMLDGGRWDGRRILSPEFVARATSPLYHLRDRGYGYLWWVDDYPYQGRTIQAFSALGAGGQMLLMFPELDLVIACYGGSYSSRGWRYMGAEFIPEHILPAVR